MARANGAAVVGAGPNGLAAAVTLARAGVPVTVFEAAETIGGGTRTTELVAPGVLHDVCSAVHPMALATGFFREFELERRVDFQVAEASYANPLDAASGSRGRDRAAIAYRSLERTAAELGRDGPAYYRFYRPLLDRLDGVIDFALGGSMLRFPADLRATLATALRTAEQGTPGVEPPLSRACRSCADLGSRCAQYRAHAESCDLRGRRRARRPRPCPRLARSPRRLTYHH